MVWEYRPDEPFVGEGPWLRTRRGRIVTAVVVGVVLLMALAGMFLPRWLGAQGLDPALNARTGLADGDYSLLVKASFHGDSDCWFRGPVTPGDPSDEVAVYGQGLGQCAAVGDPITRVVVHVENGQARIVRVKAT